jgi:hypothetical protein
MVRCLPGEGVDVKIHSSTVGGSLWRPGDLRETHGFASRPRDRFAFVDEVSIRKCTELTKNGIVKRGKVKVRSDQRLVTRENQQVATNNL